MAASVPVPAIPIPEEHKELFSSVNTFVHGYMSSPGHDNSHDYHHIIRVLSNAHRIVNADPKSISGAPYNAFIIYLAALLHDVGDHKYAKAGEDVENQVSQILLERGADEELANKVQVIVKHVGYTNEVKNPQSVINVLQRYPELAVVQDADRLDAIGAVGVARCFAFGGAKGNGRPLAGAIDHFDEKLFKLEDMMKTEAGKRMAGHRTRLMKDFAKEFNSEAGLTFENLWR
ncbi:uncharacterized protein N0V89_010036 [Didymosphaeria variabile]|uniref:HD/PDEase domain-containing protein n=1 Tax=Didymosphaeria variabile TaxID=1932322 RepID=A0A9W9C7V0_9PLEO|nr:uncharacterized protein N0V89_010036 [Didymosphaeria variabile]KAJ4348658.1 hypothetical protein N0V89_010036 [Didymosphaeria variabile]